jgi:ribosomal protein S13
LTKIKGCGRRYANIVAKKADIDLNMRYVSITNHRTNDETGTREYRDAAHVQRLYTSLLSSVSPCMK